MRKLRCVRQERREELLGTIALYSEPMKLPHLAAFLLCLATAIAAQTPPQAVPRVHRGTSGELVQQFSELLAIPNAAADPANLKRNAELLLAELQKRGIDSRLLSLPGAPAVVFGQIDVPGAQHTIVFYAHYDGQPVTPSEWDGGAPFTPTVREVNGEQRIYARSAGDDKAAIQKPNSEGHFGQIVVLFGVSSQQF